MQNWNLAPDYVYLHMGHQCGTHTIVEMSFSYNATSKEPRSHFQYELIGTDGVIRYNREERSMELRNSHGTRHLHWHGEKSFGGMYSEFAHALFTGDSRNMPTAADGLAATIISQAATKQAMEDRDGPSQSHPSTMQRSQESATKGNPPVPLDHFEPDDELAVMAARGESQETTL